MWMAGLATGLRLYGIDLAGADLIVGTSAGAIVAAVLAGGHDPSRLIEPRRPPAEVAVDQAALRAAMEALSDPGIERAAVARRAAAIGAAANTRSEQSHVSLMSAVVGQQAWPSEPQLRITATDAATGRLTVFDGAAGDSLARAVAASTAFPGIYPPVRVNGRTYIDGGVISPTNAGLAGAAQLLVVIAPLLHLTGARTLELEIARAGASATLTLAPDAAALRAFGPDLQAREPSRASYEAGVQQARAASDELAQLWPPTLASDASGRPNSPTQVKAARRCAPDCSQHRKENTMSTTAVPPGLRAAIPYLNVTDGEQAIGFYQQAFGASLEAKFPRPGGKLGHAQMRIGQAIFMFRDEYPEMGFLSPATVGGAPLNILVYVDDVHSLVEQAAAAGAKVVRPVEEQFHGDLMATLEDPFGYSWFFATHLEDISEAELERRSAQYEPQA